MRADLVLALAGGAALGASFLDFRLYPVPWLAMAALLLALEGQTPRRAFRLGFLAGVTGLALAFHWLVYALHVFGGFSRPLAGLLALAPIAWMALELALFGALLSWLRPLPLALAPPLAFTAVEFLFPSLFPWRLAHSQYRVPALLQTGELAGPYLLTFVMTWSAAALATTVRALRTSGRGAARRAAVALAGAALLVAATVGYGHVRLAAIARARAAAPTLTIGVVQGNVGVAEKGRHALFTRNLERYRDLSRALAPEAELLIWPETVFQQRIPASARVLGSALHPFPDAPRPLLFGGLAVRHADGRRELFNSAFLVREGGVIAGRYDKRVLVPFGEYMPLGDRFPRLRALSPATGNFAVGTGPLVLAPRDDARIGPLICYEDILPARARIAVRAGATVLLNLTNDAWYGDGPQPHQHQALAIWRAVETRRDLIRATNTGVTSVISAGGRVLAELPTFEPDVLLAEVRLLESTTPYVARGDVVAWSLVAALALAALWRRRH